MDTSITCLSYILLTTNVYTIVVVIDLESHVKSVPITTEVVSSNPAPARCTQYNIM